MVVHYLALSKHAQTWFAPRAAHAARKQALAQDGVVLREERARVWMQFWCAAWFSLSQDWCIPYFCMAVTGRVSL
jgi:hypothetical protein